MTLPFLLLLTTAPSLAQTAPGDEAQSPLILNARLIDREGEEEVTTANLLVRAGRLSLITKDPIPASEADLALDAENGVLMGKLALGEPASFVVLDEDPRGNVEVLLDTAAHILFAIVGGEVVRTELAKVAAEVESEPRGWLAYTPPPIALPVDYRDERKWNLFETRATSGLFAAALIVDRQRWLSKDAANERQVGELEPFASGAFPPIQERAAISDTILPSRNVGIVVSGVGANSRFSWVAGEHLRNKISAAALGDPVFTGTHVTASWVLSGEMRPYNRRSAVFGAIPVARSVYEGFWGSFEVAARWSEIDLTDGALARIVLMLE